MSFSEDMYEVADGLINEFGAKGKFLHNDKTIDRVSGVETGIETDEEVQYFREYVQAKDLVENTILSGDAKILFVHQGQPVSDWKFLDADGVTWQILAITPIEAQGQKVLYEGHIRR